MIHLDTLLLNLVERASHGFQRLTGRTSIWVAVQLTNLSIIVYFVWAGVSFWVSGTASRIFIGVFCGGLLYALTQTVFRTPVEAYENAAYRRVARGLRNPRRIRDVMLRIAFLTLSVMLAFPIAFVYVNLRLRVFLLAYVLILLTTVLLYLLACDPLPPCPGAIREWLRRTAPRLLPGNRAPVRPG